MSCGGLPILVHANAGGSALRPPPGESSKNERKWLALFRLPAAKPETSPHKPGAPRRRPVGECLGRPRLQWR